jgi:hypothetical protein
LRETVESQTVPIGWSRHALAERHEPGPEMRREVAPRRRRGDHAARVHPPPRDVVHVLGAATRCRASRAATRCRVSVEAGSPNLFCTRTGGGRYQVVLTVDSIFVWKVGESDHPAFSARWKP